MRAPERITIENLSAKAAKRLDHWMGQPDVGSVTLNQDRKTKRVKLHVQIFETIDEDEGPPEE